MSIFRELQRRNVLRVAAGYIAVSWLIVQVMDTLSDAFGFTGEHLRIAVIVLAVCFIPVMIISWAFELTPEGIKRDSEVEHGAPAAKKSAKRLDRFVMAALAIAVAYFVIDELFFEKTIPLTEAERSIAVLPFVNMSSDPEQEYFSDGISEEMLNLLAKIPELRVISRTSAFQYKNTDKEIPEIAQELRVAHVLEGSVRKAGNTIRITAQLIHAPTDAHMWSDTWDRELVDIFAIQDEIAAKVVGQLRITLLGELPHKTPVDPEAYTLYLKADQIETYGIPGKDWGFVEREAARLYERALEIEPTYVAAMGRLSVALFRIWRRENYPSDGDLVGRANEWLRRALELDPENPLANSYAAWGEEVSSFPPVAETATMIEQAFNKEPTNSEVARMAMLFAHSIGDLDTAIAIGEYVVGRDPRAAFAHYTLSLMYRDAGKFEKAEEAGKIAQALGMDLEFSIANTALFNGDPGPMLALLEDDPEPNQQVLVTLAMALHTAGREEESNEMLALFLELVADTDPLDIAMVHGWKGNTDAAFEWLERALDRDKLMVLRWARDAAFDPLHSDPRWDDVLRRLQRHPDQLANVRFEPKIPN
jgi:TolB-like protein/tetratricopeptide (TPR) repeat protein